MYAKAEPNPVQLTCLTINADNSAVVQWTESDLPSNEFSRYLIFHKKDVSSNFIEVASVTAKTTLTFTHANSNAENSSVQYYVVVENTSSSNSQSPASNVLSSLFLEVQNPTGEGVAKLLWKAIDENKELVIDKKYPNQAWNEWYRDIIPNESFNDTIVHICQDSLGYRLMQDINGCMSYSNTVIDFFENEQPPKTPEMEFVTVNHANNSAVLQWKKPPDEDVDGYYIYEPKNDTLVLIDTVKNPNQLSYEHLTSKVYSQVATYMVLAYDNCIKPDVNGELKPNASIPYNDRHHSIYMDLITQACSDVMEISWNAYDFWDPSVSDYYIMIKNVDSNQLDSIRFAPGSSTYHETVSGYPVNTNYKIWIKATNGFFISESNHVQFELVRSPNPSKPYLVTFDAQETDNWFLTFKVDVANNAEKIIFQEFDTKWITTQTQALLEDTENYISVNSITSDSVKSFRIGVENFCLIDTMYSEIIQNIHVSGAANEQTLQNELYWNAIHPWELLPSKYEVYVKDVYSDMFFFKKSLVNTRDYYFDDVSNLLTTSGEFCYYLKAIENNIHGNTPGEVISNKLCVNQPHNIYVPNAFTVNGYNPIFKPKGVFIETSSYEFKIVDRWGKTIFQTNDFNKGWDGTYKGVASPQDIYIYSIDYRDAKGQYYFKTGTVTLLQ